MTKFKNIARVSVMCLALAGSALWAEEGKSQDDLVKEMLEAAQSLDVDFESAYEAARAAGVENTVLLEGRLIRSIVGRDYAGVIALESEFKGEAGNFDYGPGKMFMSERQLFGLISIFKALQAHDDGRIEDFETHSKEAFVSAPQFVGGYGLLEMMTELRRSEADAIAMESLRIPMDMEITSAEGETRTIRDWMGNHKAMLVDFWASWCGPCLQAMPSLKAKSEALPDQGVFVAAFNTDDDDQLGNAKRIRERYEMQEVPWMMDPNGGDVSALLNINSIPRMVLFDGEGKVLYNGHPADPALNQALAKLDVSVASAY
ncbi:MAG: TlpA disulfide reductase family protein [Verrucomicrobiota bacterium]